MSNTRTLLNALLRRLYVPLAVGASSVLGATVGLLTTQGGGSAHLDIASGHPITYTHEGSDCAFGERKDPLNVVFHGIRGDYLTVREHASAHGGWGHTGGTAQFFLDHGECKRMDDASASNAGFPLLQPRFHMRYLQGPQPDPVLVTYTLAAAHHESWTHAVDGNINEPPGGFNRGRNDILKNWVQFPGNTHPHLLTETQFWGNTQHFLQNDGEFAWSDGFVYLITMPGVGGGGGTKGCYFCP